MDWRGRKILGEQGKISKRDKYSLNFSHSSVPPQALREWPRAWGRTGERLTFRSKYPTCALFQIFPCLKPRTFVALRTGWSIQTWGCPFASEAKKRNSNEFTLKAIPTIKHGIKPGCELRPHPPHPWSRPKPQPNPYPNPKLNPEEGRCPQPSKVQKHWVLPWHKPC